MAFKGPGWRELSQLMTHHVFGDVHGNKLPPIVDRNGMTYHIREDGRPARPGSNHRIIIGFIQMANLLEKMIINERSLFY